MNESMLANYIGMPPINLHTGPCPIVDLQPSPPFHRQKRKKKTQK